MNRYAFVAAASASVCSGAFSQPIPIVNAGFEAPVITACTFRGFVPATDGWTNLPGGAGGLWRPGTCWDLNAPEGIQVAYSNGGSTQQILSTSALASTTYTLSAFIGTRDHPCCSARLVRLELWAGTVNFGTRTILSSQVPPNGGWARYTLVATTPPSIPSGAKLEIRFFSDGVQADFDDFRLNQGGSTCPSDLNGDDQVDDSDFVLFVSAYNILDCADPAMPPGCPADINGDTFVDDADFVAFVGAYDQLICP
ncbi:MAG: hypothetical protein JNM86_13640 [Phycisphaerae bacterium]|nr:hypothetical protein [Phycisphaerae bacterium]